MSWELRLFLHKRFQASEQPLLPRCWLKSPTPNRYTAVMPQFVLRFLCAFAAPFAAAGGSLTVCSGPDKHGSNDPLQLSLKATRESVSEDVALLQRYSAIQADDSSGISYAKSWCPRTNDCRRFHDYSCMKTNKQQAADVLISAHSVRKTSACPLCQLAQNPSTTMYAIQRDDWAGSRVGQTVLSLAYAARNNMKFGGFLPAVSKPHTIHAGDVPAAMTAFLGCNYSDMVVQAENYEFDGCWNGVDSLGSGLDGQEILLEECRGVECRDQAVLTLPFLSALRKSTRLLTLSTPYFTGKGVKVAIHIRRGDRVPQGSAKKVNSISYASDTLYLDFLRMFQRSMQNAELHVFSTTEHGTTSEDFDVYRNLGVQVHLDGDIVGDWAHMAQADLLLIAPSTFSWVAGLLNEKCVAIFNIFTLPIVVDWIELSADLHEFKDIESCLSKRGF